MLLRLLPNALQVEGDTAKLSDAYFAVQALSKHVRAISNVQGSFTNLLLDDTTPLSTLTVSHSFSRAFLDAWQEDASVQSYAAGEDGPSAADELLTRDGRAWHRLG